MLGLTVVTISTILSILAGITVIVLNKRRAANILFGFTTFSFILLGLSNYLSTVLPEDSRLFFARAVLALTVSSVILLYYLVYSLMKDHIKRGIRLSNQTILTVSIVVFFLSFTPLMISGVDGPAFTFDMGIHAFGTFMVFFAGLTFYRLYTVMRSPAAEKQTRSQAAYLFIGFLPIVFLAPITGILMPVAYGNFDLIDITPAYSAFFILMLSYAMVKWKLFDLQFYAIRATAYLLSLFLATVIFIAPIVVIANSVFELNLGTTEILTVTAFLLVVLAMYKKLSEALNTFTNSIFFRGAYNPEEFLSNVNRSAVRSLDIETLLNEVAGTIADGLRSEHCTFLLRETGELPVRRFGTRDKEIPSEELKLIREQLHSVKERVVITDNLKDKQSELQAVMSKNDVFVAVKMVTDSSVKSDGIGFIFLGPKKGGQSYNTQDNRTLNTAVDSIIIAIQNALRYEEIERFNVTLQEKIDEATKKLRQTNQRLEEMDETKDEFISMASHQLRTPLTSVKGYLSMVLEGDAGEIKPMQEKLLSQAFTSSQRMVYLIADLLNVSRLRTGKFVIEPIRANLAKMAEGEVSQLKETAASRGLEIAYDKPKDFPDLMLDETKMRQVIMNFIDNAIYYTPSGGTITVELTDKDDAVELTVTDTGMGVPKSDQQHLFTKFYRAGNAKKARPDGTGLGLFMAKKVIVEQGGAIIFKSKEGEGSTFGFTLPKKKLVPPDIEPKADNSDTDKNSKNK
jgi:signal transduction histidine kinase